jgi:hypothetical protein
MMTRSNCTVSAIRASGIRVSHLWLVASWLAALFAPGAARADIELGHTGQTGRHRLADIYDSPGAVCDIVLPGPDSLGETWLRVNPPIIFANDRTLGEDEQPVGWQATVTALDERTGDWQVVRRSAIFRDLASDDLASYFDGQGWLAAFPVSRGTYAVNVDMLWYDPDDPLSVEGRASHAIEYFIVILRHQGEVSHGRTASACGAPR